MAGGLALGTLEQRSSFGAGTGVVQTQLLAVAAPHLAAFQVGMAFGFFCLVENASI